MNISKQTMWIGLLVLVLIGVALYFVAGQSTTQAVPPVTQTPGPTGAAIGEHCGGNMLNAPVCQAGLHCAPTPGSHLPFGDVGGTCVAD